MEQIADMKNKTSIEEHQRAMLGLLGEFDRVCKKFDIRYTLFAGTLLGAVRHKGFIPWDDDADVIMTREEYERFMKLAPGEIDTEKFFLQQEYSEHWPMFFSKLRLNGTACIERYRPKDFKTHMGVYIDIFPCDNLSDNPIKRKLQFYASKVVIAKSLDKRGYLTDSAIKKVFMAFCKLIPRKPLWKFVINKKHKNTACVHSFLGAAQRYEKSVFSRKWIEDTMPMQFEEYEFPGSKHFHELLSHLYGDYMTPLPESKRGCKVHAEIVDLNNSYENYSEIQKNIIFEEFTRSIR